jgi:carboxypeptidase T
MSWLAHDQYPRVLEILAGFRAGGREFCWTFELGRTHEERVIAGLRIHGSGRPEGQQRGVLVVGGAHAREMVPPEAVLTFAIRLCAAYRLGRPMQFGGKRYARETVRILVEALDIYIVPLLNADGRAFVETTDAMWRKNRRPPPPSSSCYGVDLNRNHDFLFSSGIRTSPDPCSYNSYRGPSAHSEPESRAIRDFLDRNGHIRGVLDVHSYSDWILYPWGNDENQTTDPTMNFRNPAWDEQRGTLGDEYREYIPPRDLSAYENLAERMRAGVREVDGSSYSVSQGFFLLVPTYASAYPTSGTLKDYPYSRHFADPRRTKMMSMCVELGPFEAGFRPEPEVATRVRSEGAVLIAEFCLGIICLGDAVLRAAAMSGDEDMRLLREELEAAPAAQAYLQRLEALGGELVPRLIEPAVATEAAELLGLALAWQRGEQPLDRRTVRRARRLLARLRKGASPGLRAALGAARDDLARVEGRGVKEGLGLLQGPPAEKPRKRRLLLRKRRSG